MIIHPYRDPPLAIPGTRILETTLGVVGMSVVDPLEPRRRWEVQGLYLPVAGRALGGIRAKVIDQKGFVSFCNQRDLEVMLGVAMPGQYCLWSGSEYLDPIDPNWFGFCCDDEDLLDDLFEREMFLRVQSPSGVLHSPLDIERRVHLDKQNDVEETYVFMQDCDPETGLFPDARFETLTRRWIRSERSKVRWERL